VIGGPDLIEEGLAESLSHPGGNVTGTVVLRGELDGKHLELLHADAGCTQISFLAYARLPRSAARASALQALARPLGMRVAKRLVSEAGDLESAFAAGAAEHDQGILVESGAVISENLPAWLRSQRYRLPAVYERREFVESGGLLSYGPVSRESFERAVALVEKILKGAKPADLPVEQPTRFELVVNLKTAAELGLTIPSSVLGRADEVIE